MFPTQKIYVEKYVISFLYTGVLSDQKQMKLKGEFFILRP